MSNKFSPQMVTSAIVDPLRYFFGNYTSKQDLVWSDDDKKKTIEIGAVNDFNRIALDRIPRVLVSRGTFVIGKTGLTDNLSSSKSVGELNGLSDRHNKVFINGNASLIIEARNEGTCELITDMVSHFIVWSRPLLMDFMGFKDFAMPMQVSEPQLAQEDTEKFQVTIQLPYTVEEDWRVNQDALKLKGFFTSLAGM